MTPSYAACTACCERELGGQLTIDKHHRLVGRFVLTDFTYTEFACGVWLDRDDDDNSWAVCGCGAIAAPLIFTTHHDQRRACALADLLDLDEGGNDGTENPNG